MEICAEADGVISQILVARGTEVSEDVLLGVISRDSVSPTENAAPASLDLYPSTTDESTIIEIRLPAEQLEGTAAKVANWIVDTGGYVKEGDPLLELETDKVTMEVTAPADGMLRSQVIQLGDEVEEGTLLGILVKQAGRETLTLESAPEKASTVSASPSSSSQCKPEQQLDSETRNARHLIGPAVRRLLNKHGLNIDLISGSGRGGRVTRDDVIAFMASDAAKHRTPNPVTTSGLSGTRVPHTPMRKSIASHMVNSLLHTAPHVTSVFEMDMERIMEHRKQCKLGFSEAGVKLTFTAYFLAACVKAMQAVPSINARFHEDALEIFDDINIGIGTALGDQGLVVPVIKQVQNKNLFEIATALQQQTDKAREGKLTPADLKDGTFTISNHGVSGSLFAAPIIINQPQVAILGIGKLEKRVVVQEVDGEDVMTIRPKCYVSLSIDHRAIDAYQTNLFLSHFVETIENWAYLPSS
ncbi:dihydrolipoamide succinyltransferase [Amphritea opalescens]|uniref:Dihydrolipoamide acetyltransferase component of pyruvate dehydrogenase complex n=2 Tax=Amphritea opalescens TaxID=2490544 RepID=A0A430KNC7_9GAMM|nr:dihydrolipoamide succinyltransferase [Amphritea opalescens]